MELNAMMIRVPWMIIPISILMKVRTSMMIKVMRAAKAILVSDQYIDWIMVHYLNDTPGMVIDTETMCIKFNWDKSCCYCNDQRPHAQQYAYIGWALIGFGQTKCTLLSELSPNWFAKRLHRRYQMCFEGLAGAIFFCQFVAPSEQDLADFGQHIKVIVWCLGTNKFVD